MGPVNQSAQVIGRAVGRVHCQTRARIVALRGKKYSKSALVHSLCIVKVVRRQLFPHFRIRQDFCQVCPRATEFGDGHQLDTGKAKRGDMFEPSYCALECALRRKGPDVHFVDGLRSKTLGKERRVRGR